MKKFKNYTLTQYLNVLSRKEPVPGGGSAAALSGALGASLLMMVGEYSLGKSGSAQIDRRIQSIITKAGAIQKRLTELVDLDAQAYLAVVKARKGTAVQKKSAQRQAERVPKEICRLCYKAIDLAPYLVQKGNPYLLSDVETAVELLWGAFRGALIFTKQ